MDGAASIGFVSDGDGRTRLAHLYQRAPLRVMFPVAGDGNPPVAVLLTTSGGLTGGDRLELDVSIGAGAAAVVTTQAAEKIYRSAGGEAAVEVRLDVEAGGTLCWLPQETILFDRARLRRRLTVDLAAGARLLAGEILVFGRRAHNERLTAGFLHDGWQVRRGGRLIWADALRLAGDLAAIIEAPAALAGAAAVATLIDADEEAPQRLGAARGHAAAMAVPQVRSSVTVIGGLLLARWLGNDARLVRAAFVGACEAWRGCFAGRPVAMPRVWEI
jgi:urease accessory protein